jgi:hypothetical protein
MSEYLKLVLQGWPVVMCRDQIWLTTARRKGKRRALRQQHDWLDSRNDTVLLYHMRDSAAFAQPQYSSTNEAIAPPPHTRFLTVVLTVLYSTVQNSTILRETGRLPRLWLHFSPCACCGGAHARLSLLRFSSGSPITMNLTSSGESIHINIIIMSSGPVAKVFLGIG